MEYFPWPSGLTRSVTRDNADTLAWTFGILRKHLRNGAAREIDEREIVTVTMFEAHWHDNKYELIA